MLLGGAKELAESVANMAKAGQVGQMGWAALKEFLIRASLHERQVAASGDT
jgi:hypothetical protein